MAKEKKTESESHPMAALHDNVNVIITSAIFLSSALSLAGFPPGHFFVSRLATGYLVFDGLWVMAVPQMVRTPVEIVLHHIATIGILYDPLVNESHGKYASMALLVEINTVLITLRRLTNHNKLVEYSFLASWVVLRLLWFLYLSWCIFFRSTYAEVLAVPFGLTYEDGPRIPAMTSWLFGAVVALQFWWTYNLGASQIKRLGNNKKDE